MIDSIGLDTFRTFVAALFTRQELAGLLRVSHDWQQILDKTEHVWTALCHKAWEGKVYVPKSLRLMALGSAAVDESAVKERTSLMSMRVSGLKEKMTTLRVRIAQGQCVEKKDFVDVIEATQKDRIERGTETDKLLHAPHLLVRRQRRQKNSDESDAGADQVNDRGADDLDEQVEELLECLPKAALRLSLADSRRTLITAEELTSFVFNVRVRADGPLAQAVPYDPYWMTDVDFVPSSSSSSSSSASTSACGEVRFTDDGRGNCYVNSTWPRDATTLEPQDPFAALGMPQTPNSLEWRLEHGGGLIRLMISSRDGPCEVVSRHPETWGFILFSQATVWTSWPMPPKEQHDLFLDDSNLDMLSSELGPQPFWD
mmetsp:Transcript_54892/g.108943  ORF Transcript_54892/g.108943 Transcript_54892/m.108943 type:complete len:372 (-) Transcript_54892:255-1370(-)